MSFLILVYKALRNDHPKKLWWRISSFKPISFMFLSTCLPLRDDSHFKTSLFSWDEEINLATIDPKSSIISLQDKSIFSIEAFILIASHIWSSPYIESFILFKHKFCILSDSLRPWANRDQEYSDKDKPIKWIVFRL